MAQTVDMDVHGIGFVITCDVNREVVKPDSFIFGCKALLKPNFRAVHSRQ